MKDYKNWNIGKINKTDDGQIVSVNLIDKNYENPQILILTNQMTSELSVIIDKISNITQETLQTYKDQKLYILGQNEIESIYSENGKVYVRCSNEIYSTKNRLYEIENLLDH